MVLPCCFKEFHSTVAAVPEFFGVFNSVGCHMIIRILLTAKLLSHWDRKSINSTTELNSTLSIKELSLFKILFKLLKNIIIFNILQHKTNKEAAIYQKPISPFFNFFFDLQFCMTMPLRGW